MVCLAQSSWFREADHGLLSKLSSYNRGISRRIYEDASQDMSEQIAGQRIPRSTKMLTPRLRDCFVSGGGGSARIAMKPPDDKG